VEAYSAVGVPRGGIYIINPAGELRLGKLLVGAGGEGVGGEHHAGPGEDGGTGSSSSGSSSSSSSSSSSGAFGGTEGRTHYFTPGGGVHYCSSYRSASTLVQEMFPRLTDCGADAPGVGARYGKPLAAEAAYVDSQFWGRSTVTLNAEDIAEAARATAALQKQRAPASLRGAR